MYCKAKDFHFSTVAPYPHPNTDLGLSWAQEEACCMLMRQVTFGVTILTLQEQGIISILTSNYVH